MELRQLREPNAAVAFVELELEPELEVPDLAAASPSMSNIRVALLPVEITTTFSPVFGTPRTGILVELVTASVTDTPSGRSTLIEELEIEVTTPRSNS